MNRTAIYEGGDELYVHTGDHGGHFQRNIESHPRMCIEAAAMGPGDISDKPWSANDITTVTAMALAVPYCDIVVTEKACYHALVSAGMDKRMNTVLLRDWAKLPPTLMNLEGHR
jgi:hypothetical protein